MRGGQWVSGGVTNTKDIEACLRKKGDGYCVYVYGVSRDPTESDG